MLPGLPAAVIRRYPLLIIPVQLSRCNNPGAIIPVPFSAPQRQRQPLPPRHRRWRLQHSQLHAGARLALLLSARRRRFLGFVVTPRDSWVPLCPLCVSPTDREGSW